VSGSLGALVLEIAARQILPALVTEVSAQAFRQAARSATQSAARGQAPAPAAPTVGLHPVSPATVISAMPGRVRLQVAGLRGNPGRATALRTRLLTLPGVSRVDASALTGKVLVEYDPDGTTLPRILAALESPAPGPARCRPRRVGAGPLALVGN